MIEVRQYIDRMGRRPFRRWLEDLDATTRARILAALSRVEQGNLSAAKPIGGGLSELRLDFGPGYHIYFARDGDTLVILFGGGTKRRQQADIDAAHALWQEYKTRKRED